MLIDELLNNKIEIKGKWYIAKPIMRVSIKKRIKDCLNVLNGKSYVFDFREDNKRK